ncbi:pseudouridine synthase [Psittacicella hinzii]|uniref:Pseudouridine synthase n=1 Tax=Psittacicella hinzii TaxID=2028575 RepID=A0A3A1YFT0_9GAMM|nr:pseudouridine synthase [Psittacicella hinzii]RIY34897.1 hypothetical protein CKF58_07415 [Psittacicella hinzii]
MKLLRLDKIISDYSHYSRSQVSTLARNGLICVNGEVVKQVSQKFDPTQIEITIDNEPLEIEVEPSVIVLHKPEGFVCANEDGVHRTVFTLLPEKFRKFHCIGRLDVDTTGLLLLTNDGQFSHKLTSPKSHVPKTYFVTLADPVEDNYAHEITQGILLKSEKDPTLPAKLELTDDPYQVYLTITEGRYHQVKRMFAALGNKVENLHRSAIGSYTLPEDLDEGEWIVLTVAQAEKLIRG